MDTESIKGRANGRANTGIEQQVIEQNRKAAASDTRLTEQLKRISDDFSSIFGGVL